MSRGDEQRWERTATLFDRLLAGAPLEETLASEADPEIRRAVEDLWSHHLRAAQTEFLTASPEFSVPPVFENGQILANRFRIDRMLGRGGMGEVYLAFDSKMEEPVALKTIARLLAPFQALRRRIVAEVQNARRVTHPNVCRIHELFEDENNVFFSMQYLEGTLLSERLHKAIPSGEASLLARQIGEGLHSAHRTGVIHGDLKPANVMLIAGSAPRAVIMDFGLARAVTEAGAPSPPDLSMQAGTADFMAPELKSGGTPSIRSDIYAFGKILQLLLPGHPLGDWCSRQEPAERPASLEPVLRKLEPRSTRRVWLAAAATATAGAVGYSLWRSSAPAVYFPHGARVFVNGFRTVAATLSSARFVRSLLLTALAQSPRIRAIADQDLLPELARVLPGGGLPIAGAALEQLIGRIRANFLIEADLSQTSDRFSLQLRILRAGQYQVIAEQAFRDQPGVTALARQAALWLRRAAGESTASLEANPVAVETYTSAVPEALEKYYEAMDHWALADLDLAIPLLEEAVRLDPNFAQAHCLLGMLLNIAGQNARAYDEVERAQELSTNLPDRERAWVETNVSALREDSAASLRNALRNVTLYPDEPRVYRWLARIMCRAGDAREAIPHNRKAVELSSGDELQRSELMNNLCEAGQFQQAQSEFEAAQANGIRNRWLFGSGGLAYTGMERYDEALAAYANEPAGHNRTLDILRAKVLAGDLAGSVALARESLASAESIPEKHQSHETLCGLYYVTDQAAQARTHLQEMIDLPAYPQMARRLDCTSFWAARLADKPALAAARERLASISDRWPSRFTQGLMQHAQGLEAWTDGSFSQAESLLLASAGAAFSPWCLLDLGDLYAGHSNPASAEEYYQRFDQHRGTILSFWFSGTLVLSWLRRASAALARTDRTAARSLSQKVLEHWSKTNPRLRIVQAAGNIHHIATQM